MKRITGLTLAVLTLGACEDAIQPVGVDDPSAMLSRVSDAACINPALGLVSWWPGDGHFFDIVDINHGIPFQGATTAPAVVGDGFSLDGVDDVILTSGLNIDDLQHLTIDTWVKLNSLPSGRIERFVTLIGEKAVIRYDGANGPRQLHFYMNIDDGLRHVRVNNVLQVGVFHHVAGTYDGSVMRLYLDGVEVGSQLVSGAVGPGDGVELGSQAEALDGLLDEVEIYDRALSASEIQAIYDAGSAGKCKPTPTAPCPKGVDVFVTDEERLFAAVEAARPGDVIGLDGYIGVSNDVDIWFIDDLTLTCATPGSGLYATHTDAAWLIGVRANRFTVDRLVLDATGARRGPFMATCGDGFSPVRDIRFTNNTVTCGPVECAFFLGAPGAVVEGNYFQAEGAVTGVHMQHGWTEDDVEVLIDGSRIVRNTIVTTAPAPDNPWSLGGIRVRDGSDVVVAHNEVRGPWPNSIHAAELTDSQFKSNTLEGAVWDAILLYPEVHENVFRNNQATGAGEAGTFANWACGNTFIGNNFNGNANDYGAWFWWDTGANTLVGNQNVVVDDGDWDCDEDGEIDPNIITGLGAVMHGVKLGKEISEAASSWKDLK